VLFGTACKKPDTQIIPRPINHVEVRLRIEGIRPEEENQVRTELSEKLELLVEPLTPKKPNPYSWIPGYGFVHMITSSKPIESEDSSRVLEVIVGGKKSSYAGAGLPKTILINTGYGTLVGAAVGGGMGFGFTSWPAVGIGSAVGGVVGCATGPMTFNKNEATRKSFGYIPWEFGCRWSLIARNPDNTEKVLARGTVEIPPWKWKSHLKPISESSISDENIREENIRACTEILGVELKGKIESLRNGYIPHR
jgi:hypothetical protein